jgi:carbonyl reductase 1
VLVFGFLFFLKSIFCWVWQINNAAMQKYQSEAYEDAVDTIETNYFGTRRVTEKLLPLLRASPFGARIVMVSSQVGQMEVTI